MYSVFLPISFLRVVALPYSAPEAFQIELLGGRVRCTLNYSLPDTTWLDLRKSSVGWRLPCASRRQSKQSRQSGGRTLVGSQSGKADAARGRAQFEMQPHASSLLCAPASSFTTTTSTDASQHCTRGWRGGRISGEPLAVASLKSAESKKKKSNCIAK